MRVGKRSEKVFGGEGWEDIRECGRRRGLRRGQRSLSEERVGKRSDHFRWRGLRIDVRSFPQVSVGERS